MQKKAATAERGGERSVVCSEERDFEIFPQREDEWERERGKRRGRRKVSIFVVVVVGAGGGGEEVCMREEN